MSDSRYLLKLRRNLILWPIRTAIQSCLFFMPIWYSFETQFADPGTLSLIYALTTFLTTILELPTGAIADLLGRRFSVILGLMLVGISFIYLSFSQDTSWLWTGYILLAVGSSFVSGADEALIYDSLKDLKMESSFVKYSSRNGLIFRLGLVAASFIGGYLYTVNRGLPYLLVGIFSLGAAGLTFLFTEPKTDSQKFTLSNYFKQTKLGFRQLFKSREQSYFSAYYIVIAGVTTYYAFFLYLAFANHLGFSDLQISRIIPVIYIIDGFLIYFLSRFTARISKKLVVVSFPVILLFGCLPGFWISPFLGVFCMALITLANMARYAFLNQIANQEYDSKYRATAISTLNMFTSLVFVLISLAASRLINIFGAGFLLTGLGLLILIAVVPLTLKILHLSNQSHLSN